MDFSGLYEQEFPSPYSEDRIKPKMRVFGSVKDSGYKLRYSSNVTANVKELRDNKYLSKEKLIFIVHGYLNSWKWAWLKDMKDAILRVEESATVIVIDWKKGSGTWWNYLQAASNIQTVGRWLGKRVAEIRRQAPQLSMWGIGHSLGAHVVGMAGKESNGGLDRITGLDPAAPSFEKKNQGIRLQRTDAKMVDVIHTDGFNPESMKRKNSHLGTLIPLGTIDFYPNYGYDQPETSKLDDLVSAESHTRAIHFFTWSIENKGEFLTNQQFKTAPDIDKPTHEIIVGKESAEMGYYADQAVAKEGLFYLSTDSMPPPDSGLASLVCNII